MPLQILEPLTRAAEFRPDSFNDSARTVEVVWSTGAGVQRRGPQGIFTEILSLDPGHVSLSRLNGGSVLNGHRQGDVRDVIGTIVKAEIRDGKGVALIRLSARDDVKPVLQDIKDGILRHVSIGYRVNRWTDGTDSKGGRTRTAVEWEPFEISLVPVPADPGATTRSQNMPETPTEPQTQPAPATPPVPENERSEHRAQVRAIARSAGLSSEWADSQIDSESDLTAVRAAAFEEMQQRSNPRIRVQQSGPSGDDPSVMLNRRTDALAARAMGTAPSDEARPYYYESIIDHLRAMMNARGIATAGLSPDSLLQRAAQHTVSDFPELLTGTGNRTLQASFQAQPAVLKAVARQTTMKDFRPQNRLRLGELSGLQKVTESGEIKAVSRAETKESYALETYAGLFNMSRKAWLNDDLSAFRDWAMAAGQAAAQLEANTLVALLTQSGGAGPVMQDGTALFHADHGNLAGAGAAPDVTTLGAARQAMREQTGLDGKTPINAIPKFLLVGADLETKAEQLLASIAAATVADANPFSNKLTLLVESRLPASAWYVFADPAMLATLEYAYLSSAQGPQISTKEGWDVLGMEFRVFLDFGAGAVDHRGAYRNPGA